ncbi:MAG: DUF4019 domain-containing protein [Planctomycetes bacterium]|nr:DUF4019 domain-containing protein [Planctomycetota bacterium]
MSTVARGQSVLAGVWVLAIAIVLCGCPSAETKHDQKEPLRKQADSTAEPAAESRPEPEIEKPPKTPAEPTVKPEKLVAEAAVEAGEKPRDLGPPLVDNPDQLTPLSQDQPVWIDTKNKQVVLLGEVCEAGYPLEFFASNAMKAYESVVTVNVTPFIVHAGLLRIGAKPGHPVRFQPRFVPPTGTEIAVEVRWKDSRGKVQSAPAQHWIRNINTKKELDVNWVFAGSFFRTNEETGEKYYQANFGALICVLNLPNAMLDLPIESFGAIEARSFEAFKEHLPPAGTPTTLLLKPIFDDKPTTEIPARRAAARVGEKIAEAERKALEAAEDWLELVDRQQYSRGWETASERLNVIIARRDFIKSLNDTRKPLGKVKARRLSSKKYTRSIPDAPDGQYVVIQYTASFENKPSAVEMVTMMLNGDNRWRVLGYHFK